MKEHTFVPKKKTYDTAQHERELLHHITKDSITLRRVIGRLKREWMTDETRLFILDLVLSTFRDTHTLMTKDAFLYELEKNTVLTGNKPKYNAFRTEIEIVYSIISDSSIDFLTEKLEEADRADVLAKLLEESFVKLEAGDVEGAVQLAKKGAVHITSKKQMGEAVDIDRESEKWFEGVMKRKENPGMFVGIQTGFAKFDLKTGGLFPAELIIVFGLSGKGKSTVLKAICNSIRENGYNVLHVTNEENGNQVQTKYQTIGSGIEYFKYKWGKISDDEVEKWKEFNKARRAKKGGIFVLEVPQYTDVSLIEEAFFQLRDKGVQINVICMDYMDLMKPTQKAYSENDEQGKVTGDLKQLAVDCDVPVITATQAATTTQKQETRDNPFLTAQDIYGTKRKAHAANVLIGIVNKSANVGIGDKDEKVKKPHTMVFCVPKNRDGESFVFRQIMYPEFGRFEEDTSEPTPEIKKVEEMATAIVQEEDGSTKRSLVIRKVQEELAQSAVSVAERLSDKTNAKMDAFEQRTIKPSPSTTASIRQPRTVLPLAERIRMQQQKNAGNQP